ncbi:hypothetical protein JQ633_01420 [Bradyrhizobium tropiciagri]|uniref:hypothetical protein n=1 Tax=Bradyrhizobium tropiciagri TaxID=312253 RepID=UPI001BAE25B8|nr:hypothetical protein [Bradyrhizobium tropiciagri]MBR0869001.1 hypothetical protein [Bradyrhizobium tropiciagri]
MSEQLARLEQLRRDGHDTAEAIKHLRDFEAVLAKMREHRSIIVDTIRQIDAGLI